MGPKDRTSKVSGMHARTRRVLPASQTRRPPRMRMRTAAVELERIHARRLRACASLGLSIPNETAEGPRETLLRRIAVLDRRIEVSLDLAGGVHFPPWTEEEDRPRIPGGEEPEGDFS